MEITPSRGASVQQGILIFMQIQYHFQRSSWRSIPHTCFDLVYCRTPSDSHVTPRRFPWCSNNSHSIHWAHYNMTAVGSHRCGEPRHCIYKKTWSEWPGITKGVSLQYHWGTVRIMHNLCMMSCQNHISKLHSICMTVSWILLLKNRESLIAILWAWYIMWVMILRQESCTVCIICMKNTGSSDADSLLVTPTKTFQGLLSEA